MCSSENQSAMTRYNQMKVVVVEVRTGESQEKAWRRYLSEHPESLGVRVKIFHYPSQDQKEKATQSQIEQSQSKKDKF